ncbi:CCCH-type zinc finger-containing protein [Reticulomyxa filosa]|uniref:CCCH-type zinc finger-containing protein n=1 Tax=Reticulomyxa filosa TaxID=46433 RepID=X6NME5_RETFI|nr:CCCH-type zinc finger-containing protein [Reticulomyxa filosa]|eukprot:ETO27410.1 CCCH-type zinc finger-containing protein [Reticulomyxa filosa]
MLCRDDEFENLHLLFDVSIDRDAERRKKRVFESFVYCPTQLKEGKCTRGKECPHRHSRGEKSIVCKHWLRGLCKKDDNCEFLHMYDMSKLPPCHFFNTFGQCKNPECLFLHLREDEMIKECPWYARGFCKHGPNCRNKHVRRIVCDNYYEKGFCRDGPNCPFGHPKYELPTMSNTTTLLPPFCTLVNFFF